MRVYISAFGSGLGHATRMLPLARAITGAGGEARFSSSGEVVEFIRRNGFACNALPLVDVVWNDEGAFSAMKTAKLFPVLMLRAVRQLQLELANLERFGPSAVLSDSMLTSSIASRLLGRRTVTVLNQLKLLPSPRTPKVFADLISTGSITLVDEFWNLSDSILLPDLPPPYTISERNLWNAGRASRKARYIGFLLPDRSDAEDDLTKKVEASPARKVFWQVSGPPGTRAPLLGKALEVSKKLRDRYVFIISEGNPNGSSRPVEVPGGWLYGWCNQSDRYFDICDLIVTRAGHGTIARLISRGTPSVIIPIPSQTEQEGNAAKAEKLGAAVKIEQPELTAEAFEEAFSVLTRGDHAGRAAELMRIAGSYDAKREILSELSG